MIKSAMKMILLALLLSGCGGPAVRNNLEGLDRAIQEYAYALRWQRKEDAVSWHLNRDGSHPKIDASSMDQVRVTGFTIKDKTLDADMKGATVVGEMEYYHNEYGTVKKIEYRQSWWFEEKSKKWFVDNPFPEFK